MDISYKSVLDDIFQLRLGRRSDCGLMETILGYFDNPHQCYPIIHVAGTNGKGSVCAKLAQAFQLSGYKVGLYISPHLFDFAERISINGKTIPHEKVVEYYLQLKPFLERDGLKPNFFEWATSFGFRYFQEEKVDIAIIEVGLGGKVDATNVVNPILSVITSINFDHTEILGNTLEEIAEQKAGIIKEGVPVVVGYHARFSPIYKKGQEAHAKIHDVEVTDGVYEEENKAIVKKALKVLGKKYSFTDDNIEKGLQYNLSCRFEKKGNVIYDVAHNPNGFARLKKNLHLFFPGQTFRFVIGMGESKDIEASLREIAPIAHFVHFVQAKTGVAADPKRLKTVFDQSSSAKSQIEESVSQGFIRAKKSLKENEILVVCGSFYIMSEIDFENP